MHILHRVSGLEHLLRTMQFESQEKGHLKRGCGDKKAVGGEE